jgi:hypothetical protein
VFYLLAFGLAGTAGLSGWLNQSLHQCFPQSITPSITQWLNQSVHIINQLRLAE